MLMHLCGLICQSVISTRSNASITLKRRNQEPDKVKNMKSQYDFKQIRITQEWLGIKTIVIEFMKIIGKYTSPILSAQRNTTGHHDFSRTCATI